MDPKVEKKQGFTDPNQTDLLGPDEDTGVRDLYIKKKENLSVFEKFIQKISDAFSSAYSTISRIFRSSDQQAAAISNINAQPIESSSNIYNKFESETPPNGPTAQSLFKIEEDLQEKGKED